MSILNINHITDKMIDEVSKYNNIEYKYIVQSYKKILNQLYENRYNSDFNETLDLLIYIFKIYKIKQPFIKNSPIFYILKDIKVKDVDYRIIKKLGQGEYGRVYKVEIKNKIYALKELDISDKDTAHSFLNEIKKYKKVNKIKPQISPKYYDSWINEENGYILIEYMNYGTLGEYINIKGSLNKKEYSKIEILIKTLHKHKLYHNDLHLNNILLSMKNNNINFFISDFGLALSNKNIINQNIKRIIEYKSKSSFIKNELKISVKKMIQKIICINIINNNVLKITNIN